MRPASSVLVVATVLGALAPVASAQAAPPTPRAEKFVMTFHTFEGVDQPTRIRAVGPVPGAGTETQSDLDTPDGEVVAFTWHLPGGDVQLEAVEDYSITFDLQACTAKGSGTGTWTITGGTGDYAGAAGSGTFTDQGSFTGARDHGVCEGPESNTPPRTSVFTLTGTGTATLGN
jgi:hypothetical protein